MINQYLFDGYEEYTNNRTYEVLTEFANKTFPQNGTDKLFIGCSIILYRSVVNKNYANTHALLSILKAGKDNEDGINLLKYYFENINDSKDVSRYLKKELYSKDYLEHLDMLIDYFSGWSYNFYDIVYEKYMAKNRS